jgi:hypothetical protein
MPANSAERRRGRDLDLDGPFGEVAALDPGYARAAFLRAAYAARRSVQFCHPHFSFSG